MIKTEIFLQHILQKLCNLTLCFDVMHKNYIGNCIQVNKLEKPKLLFKIEELTKIYVY